MNTTHKYADHVHRPHRTEMRSACCAADECTVTERSPSKIAGHGRYTFKILRAHRIEEVAILRHELGPLVGGEDRLSFDVLNGTMTVLDQALPISAKDIREAVRRTGMTAVEWRPEVKDAREAGDRHRRQQVWFTSLSGLFVVAGFIIHVWLVGGFADAFRLLAFTADGPCLRLR